MPLIDRLEASSIPEPNSGCHLWLRGTHPRGYGILWIDGVCWIAHRASWAAHKGPIPKGLQVLHKCDVRACINPDHLFLGTNADNMADKVAKGRQTRGADNGPAKLTEAQVIAIRADTRTQMETAASFGIAQATVSKIKSRQVWAHVL